jgi:hypothetical protein
MKQIVLRRREAEELKKARGWLLVYGRRKVGKTFLLRSELSWSIYATVTRSREIFLESDGGIEKTGLEEGLQRVVDALRRGECVVIDEFQRLPENYWDMLALAHPSGRLVLSGSSFGVVEKVFSRRSPLLGLVNPLRVDVVSYADAVSSLVERLGPEKALLWGIIVRDPWIVPFVDLSLSPAVFIAENAGRLALASMGLVGEVFVEEERRLTTLYEAVLRLLAEGYWKPARIAGVLAPKGLVEGGASAVVGILERMVKMGLVRKLKAWKSGGAKAYYRHSSPLLSLVYYLDQKFSVSEGYPATPEAANTALGREAEACIAELMAERYSGVPGFYVSPFGDVDVIVLKGRRPIADYEVKLGIIELNEAKRAVERIHSLGIPHAGLISLKEKPPEIEGAETLGPDELVYLAKMVSETKIPTKKAHESGELFWDNE